MKAYSLDLRQKIVHTYNRGGISQRGLANTFGVALSFVQKILKQYRETGDLAPKTRSQQTPTKLSPENLSILEETVKEAPDATLEELRHELHKKVGVLIGRSTMGRMIKKLGFTLKKKRYVPKRNTLMAFNSKD